MVFGRSHGGCHTRPTTHDHHDNGNGDPRDDRGPTLLGIARATLEERLLDRDDLDRRSADTLPRWLLDRAATFVSLHHDTKLRGCVGSLEPVRTLYDDVRRNALAAAFEDSRFPPLTPEELDGLCLEVTLLSAREPLAFGSERDALEQLRPGVDGLLLTYGSRRATFLPQVWESLPRASTFLDALKEKAGLERGFWHRTIVLERYTAQIWSESD